MTRIPRILLAAVASVALSAVAGPAATSAAVIGAPPAGFSDELVCIQPLIGSACYHGAAQTFTASADGALIAVEMILVRQPFTATTRPLTVEVHDGSPDGALLATSTPVPASQVPTNIEHYYDPDATGLIVLFPAPASVTAGQVLAVVIPIEPLSDTSDPAWGWAKSTVPDAGGVAWGGTAPGTWEPYQDGSDLALGTHIRTSPPDCDLWLVIGLGHPIHDAATIGAERIEFFGTDFGSLTQVTVEVRRTDDGPPLFVGTTRTRRTDIDGDFGGDLVFKAQDAGEWDMVAYPTDDPTCVDSVHLTVRSRTIVVPGTPAPSAGTAGPSSPGPVPDTSMEAASTGPSDAGGALLVVGLAGLLAIRLVRAAVLRQRTYRERHIQ